MKKIKVLVSLIVLATFFAGCESAPQKTNQFKEKSDLIYKNINDYFYDQKANLYFETVNGKSGKDEKKNSYLWPLSAVFQAYAQINSRDANQDKAMIEGITKSLESYYSKEDSIGSPGYGLESYVANQGGGQRYFDDNEWIGLTFCDLYESTKNRVYLEKAKDIYKFVMSGKDKELGGGIYWREGDSTTKNTCSNGPQIVLGLKLFVLAGNTRNTDYLKDAIGLFKWVNKTFRSPENLYWDKQSVVDKTIDKTTWTYNTGIMIQANVLLYKITKDPKYLNDAKLIAQSSLDKFAPNGLFPDTLWFNAVLLRGYKDLRTIDADNKYIAAFENYALNVWDKQRDLSSNLIQTKEPATLIDQAAMLEIYSSLFNIFKKHD